MVMRSRVDLIAEAIEDVEAEICVHVAEHPCTPLLVVRNSVKGSKKQ